MKRTLIAVFGVLLLLAGLALLVLPGPGFVLIAAALALLATQFEWAKKPLDYAKDKAQQGIDEVAKSPFRTSLTVLSAFALVVVGILDLTGIDIPFVTMLSAILLIVSGVFLVGTVVYAIRKSRQAASARS